MDLIPSLGFALSLIHYMIAFGNYYRLLGHGLWDIFLSLLVFSLAISWLIYSVNKWTGVE